MKHELLVLGKIKDSFLAEGVTEYSKRLCHYTSFEMKVLNERGKSRKKQLSKEQEGEILLGAVPPGAFKVVLDSQGKQFTSEQLADCLQQWQLRGLKQVCYLVGGPEGHGDNILGSADLRLSLSRMTFTHDMVRMLIIEQLYRAHTIVAGEKYHK